MRRLGWWAFLLFVCAQLGGWLSVSDAAAQPQPQSKAAAEPQSAQQGPRLARLYFLREKGYSVIETPIKIDGKQVGIVTKGFYIAVSTPPGRHRITCVNSLSADFEAEVQVAAGQTYYFGIGVPQSGPPVQNLVNQAIGGSSGRQLPGTSFKSGFSATAFYQIDAAEGRPIVSQMKRK